MPEKREIPVKDFLEEHRKLKEEKTAPPAPPSSPPATPQLSKTPPSTSPTPALAPYPAPAPLPTPALTLPPASQEVSDSGPISFVQLVESLKSLGYDVKPLESLRSFAELLDGEEQKLVREISERQKRLETVRMARRLLKILGV